MPLNQKLTTPNNSPEYQRLSPLLFDGKNHLQQCFYDYLATTPISIGSVPASLIDKLSKFYHFDDAAKIEHSCEALNSLIKQAGKRSYILPVHIFTALTSPNKQDSHKIHPIAYSTEVLKIQITITRLTKIFTLTILRSIQSTAT